MSAFEDKVKGNWNQIKGNLKQKYAELSDDDLAYEEGKEDELLGRIQEKTGEAKESIKNWIDSL
ncbi:MAG: CsbD family protein [Bacteroidota bacterium]